jgi:hypothetical protein
LVALLLDKEPEPTSRLDEGEWVVSDLYLIESIEHTYGDVIAWWGPNSIGYTSNLDHAGRYSKEKAEEICAGANYSAVNERMWKESDVLKGEAGYVARTVQKR